MRYLGIFLLGISVLARAETQGSSHVCYEDRIKFCPDSAGGPEAKDCMWSHLDELAPACKAAYLEGKRKFDEDEALRQLELKLSACASDVKKHCGKSATDAERLSCLKNKLAKVGNACRKAMEQK